MPKPKSLSSDDTATPGPGREAYLVWLGPEEMMPFFPIQSVHGALPGLPAQGRIEATDLAGLEDAVMRDPAPIAVLSPLFWQGGDVMEAARILCTLDFRGAYRILSLPLPRPEVVENEVRAFCPDLDFEILRLQTPEEGGPS